MPYQDIMTLIERIGYEHLLQAYGMTETLIGHSVTYRVATGRRHGRKVLT